MPNLEVHDLRPTDTDGDSQHFRTGHALTESGVEAGAGLLDKGKVKSSGVGDSLDMVRVVQVALRYGNCRMLCNSPRHRIMCQTRNSLRKRRAKIRVLLASITSPPSRVHTELLEVCEPSRLRDSWHCAWG